MECTGSTADEQDVWTVAGVHVSSYNAGMEDVIDKLRMFGEALCMILDILPSDQFSFIAKVSDTCSLEFTVKKI